MIPAIKKEIQDKPKRFYVFAPASVYLALQEQAFKREVDFWHLCGAVLGSWVAAGCPDSFVNFPRPSSSSLAKPLSDG